MWIYIFFLNWILSIIFMFLNHPLSLGYVLLMQTILISLSSGFLYHNFWFGYILFLIMIGGLLVMFLYMTSIASNEKFKMPKNMKMFCFIAFLLFMGLFLIDKFYANMLMTNLLSKPQSCLIFNLNLNKFFNKPSMYIMFTLMMYLLLTLIAVVKITGKNFGTLRKK